MTTVLLVLPGVILITGGLLAFTFAASGIRRRQRAMARIRAQQRRSEARIRQISQDALQQMLDATRHSSR